MTEKKQFTCTVISLIGAVILLLGIVLYMVSGANGLGTVIISVTFLLTLFSTLLMLIGIAVLIAQKVRKISRPLTKKQLVCGFGFKVFGALAAGVAALVAVIADLWLHCEAGIFLSCQMVMCVGGLVCFAFGLPLFKLRQKS